MSAEVKQMPYSEAKRFYGECVECDWLSPLMGQRASAEFLVEHHNRTRHSGDR